MMETEVSESNAEIGNLKLIQVECEFNSVHLSCRTRNAGKFNY